MVTRRHQQMQKSKFTCLVIMSFFCAFFLDLVILCTHQSPVLNPDFLCGFLLSCVFSINISGTFTTRPGSLRFLQSVLSYFPHEAEYLTVNKNFWATLVTLRMEMRGKSECVATTRVARPLADGSVS